MGKEFHSKLYIFYKDCEPFACIIGSSNFTAGGIYNNIETNAVLDDPTYLKEVDREFSKLWEISYKLQPSDFASFKIIFDNFRKNAEKEKIAQELFEEKLLRDRSIKTTKPRIGKQADKNSCFSCVN